MDLVSVNGETCKMVLIIWLLKHKWSYLFIYRINPLSIILWWKLSLFVLQVVGSICSGLPALSGLNLTNNMMSHAVIGISHLTNIRILVLNNTTITWSQVKQNQCFPYFHLAITCLKQSMEIVNDFDFICRLKCLRIHSKPSKNCI